MWTDLVLICLKFLFFPQWLAFVTNTPFSCYTKLHNVSFTNGQIKLYTPRPSSSRAKPYCLFMCTVVWSDTKPKVFVFLSKWKCVIILYVYLMYIDLFFPQYISHSLCQPCCKEVLNPDKLKLFNYLNPGPRNHVQWFILVCMRHVGEKKQQSLLWLMTSVSVCVCKRERE